MRVHCFYQLWGTDEQKDLYALNNFLSLIDKVSFKTNSMSLGLVHLEKLFMQTWMHTLTLQSDAIMLTDCQVSWHTKLLPNPCFIMTAYSFKILWNGYPKMRLDLQLTFIEYMNILKLYTSVIKNNLHNMFLKWNYIHNTETSNNTCPMFIHFHAW